MRAPGVGQVTYVTAERAYLDRGTADGVAVGQTLAVSRRGVTAGTCRVETAGDHVATCAGGANLHAGDRFAFSPPPAPPPPERLVEPPGPEALAPLRARLEGVLLPLREFEGGATRPASGLRLDARLEHTSWLGGAGLSQAFYRERVEAAVRDVEVWRGVRFSADVAAVAWAARPLGFRFEYRSPWQLYVRQAELSYRADGSPLAASVGRVAARRAVGLTVLDGAQVGWRSDETDTEVGAYGGMLPDLVTLVPQPQRWTAGVYATRRFALGKDVLLQPELRLAWVARPGATGRLEVQAAARAHVREAFEVHLEALLGTQGQAASPGLLDAVRVDVSTSTARRLRGSAGLRYWGGGGDPYSALTTLPLGHWLRGDARGAFQLLPWLEVGARFAGARDFDAGLTQLQVGPEVAATFFGGRAGAGLTYDEEVGWLRGRSAALVLSVQPASRLRLLGRVAWFQQQGTVAAPGVSQSDMGAYLSLQLAVWRMVWLRASALGRFGLDEVEWGRPVSLTANVTVGATW